MIVLANHNGRKIRDYRLLPEEERALKLQELIRILQDIQAKFGAEEAIVKSGCWDDNAYDGTKVDGVRYIKDMNTGKDLSETVFIMTE